METPFFLALFCILSKSAFDMSVVSELFLLLKTSRMRPIVLNLECGNAEFL